jgi:predicted O-methyltransferase YrrM
MSIASPVLNSVSYVMGRCHGIRGAALRRVAQLGRAKLTLELAASGSSRDFRIRTDATRDELLLLYTLAKRLRGGTAVEIGSYLGASSCFLAAGCRRAGAHLYCVDTWLNDAMTEGPKDTWSEFVANTERHRATITPIRQPSTEAAEHFSGRIDMLFVDGDHSIEGVRGDLHAWLPHLSPGAWLALHDSGWAKGVQSAITEILEPIRSGPPITLPNLYCVRVDPRDA